MITAINCDTKRTFNSIRTSIKNSFESIKQSIKLFLISNFLRKEIISMTYIEAISLLNDIRTDSAPVDAINFKQVEVDLSIIIPVYNAEKYIGKCIESVLEQVTKYSFEVIIINDGSVDASLEVIKSFYSDKISSYSIMNSGPGHARNIGLSKAKGKFILFLDADDYLLPNAIELLFNIAMSNNSCIVEGNFYYLQQSSFSLSKPSYPKLTIVNVENDARTVLSLNGYVGGRIYNRYLFEFASFPNYKFEDTIIYFIIIRRAKIISITSTPIFVYRLHEESESGRSNKGSPSNLDTFYIISYLINLNNKLNLEFDDVLYRFMLRQLGALLYFRNSMMGERVVDALIVAAKNLLDNYESFVPTTLTYKERCLKKAIQTLNKRLYKVCLYNEF